MKFTDEQIAEIAHDANNALERILNDPAPSDVWLNEPAEVKARVVSMVREARSSATPRDIHEHWRSGLLAKGWVWAPEKDWVRKTHPCLQPYEYLPEEQRAKDRLFLYIVTALAVGN